METQKPGKKPLATASGRRALRALARWLGCSQRAARCKCFRKSTMAGQACRLGAACTCKPSSACFIQPAYSQPQPSEIRPPAVARLFGGVPALHSSTRLETTQSARSTNASRNCRRCRGKVSRSCAAYWFLRRAPFQPRERTYCPSLGFAYERHEAAFGRTQNGRKHGGHHALWLSLSEDRRSRS